jgi:hypothetical protein
MLRYRPTLGSNTLVLPPHDDGLEELPFGIDDEGYIINDFKW